MYSWDVVYLHMYLLPIAVCTWASTSIALRNFQSGRISIPGTCDLRCGIHVRLLHEHVHASTTKFKELWHVYSLSSLQCEAIMCVRIPSYRRYECTCMLHMNVMVQCFDWLWMFDYLNNVWLSMPWLVYWWPPTPAATTVIIRYCQQYHCEASRCNVYQM